jgi:hypothetical protein
MKPLSILFDPVAQPCQDDPLRPSTVWIANLLGLPVAVTQEVSSPDAGLYAGVALFTSRAGRGTKRWSIRC